MFTLEQDLRNLLKDFPLVHHKFLARFFLSHHQAKVMRRCPAVFSSVYRIELKGNHALATASESAPPPPPPSSLSSAVRISSSQIIVPDWGDKVNSGIGFSYRPASLCSVAYQYDNTMPEFFFFSFFSKFLPLCSRQKLAYSS